MINAQKMIKKDDQKIWSHLLQKSLMENFIFLCSGYQKNDLIKLVNYVNRQNVLIVKQC